jgi:hypothetical protein
MSTVPTPTLTDLLDRHAEKSYQIWVHTPEGGLYAYRTDLIYAVALNWSAAFETHPPTDVPEGSAFIVVESVTTFSLV